MLLTGGCGATNRTSYNDDFNRHAQATQSTPSYRPARLLHSVRPIFPVGAKLDLYKKFVLSVLVDFVVNEEGKPKEIVVFSTQDRFYDSVFIECVAQWRFEPATVDGIAVRQKLRLPITLELKDAPEPSPEVRLDRRR
jgi:TonB family protein